MRNRLLSCLIISFSSASVNLSAQQLSPCATIGVPGISTPQLQKYSSANKTYTTGTKYIKLKVNIASLPGPGGDAISKPDFQKALDTTNQRFAASGIQFVICGDINIIDDMALYYITTPATLNPYHVYGYLNVTIAKNQGIVSGYSGIALPDHIVIGSTYIFNYVLEHELGHELGLLHTHESSLYGAELVNGSNCSTAGDLICDTPADPGLGTTGMVNYTTCSYTGTALDANSQPYTPLVNNIMAYSYNKCHTSFTNGQIAQMNFILDSVKTYLRTTSNPVSINPFTYQFCTYDNPYTLSAVPTPGNFTGPQISLNQIIPQNGPPANYSVYYSPASAPDPATSYIDQFSYTKFLQDTANYIWQSFTTRETGTLVSVDFKIRNLSTNTITFSLYSGSGTGGTLLFSGNVIVNAMNNYAWVSFPVGITLNPSPGTVYTAAISNSNPGFAFYLSQFGGYYDEDYQYGTSNFFGKDVAFREKINGVPPCQDCYKYYKVYQAPNGNFTGLASVYCVTDDTLDLKGDQPVGYFTLDGVNATVLNPSALSNGSHAVSYISTTSGCTDTTSGSFEVVTSTASFTNVNSTMCTIATAFVPSTGISGGTLTIDNVAATSFDPALLGIGMHQLSYTNTNTHDTISFTDQQCLNGTYQNYIDLLQDSVYYQSFRCSQSGQLNNVTLKYYINTDTLTYEIKLYSGKGINGPVLKTDTVRLGGSNYSWIYPPLFSGLPILNVTDDMDYTFSLKRIADAFPSSVGTVSSFQNLYLPGISNLDTNLNFLDFYFKENITQYTGCDVTATDSILVTICTGIAENNISGFTVHPNPVGTYFILKTNNPGISGILSVYDASGRLCLQNKINQTNNVTDISALQSGIYFVEFSSGGTRKIVKLVKD